MINLEILSKRFKLKKKLTSMESQIALKVNNKTNLPRSNLKIWIIMCRWIQVKCLTGQILLQGKNSYRNSWIVYRTTVFYWLRHSTLYDIVLILFLFLDDSDSDLIFQLCIIFNKWNVRQRLISENRSIQRY